MKPLEELDLGAADLQRIDEIITRTTGRSLGDEVAQWRRRRNRFWMCLSLGLALLLAAAGWVSSPSWP